MRGAALALALAPGALGAQGAGEPVGALVTVAADASRQHLARLPDGRIRVVYEAPDADGSGIWLRRYDAAGEPLDGAPLALNTVTAGAQERPRLALAPDGRGWVVWQSLNVDGSSRGIVARRLAEDGRPLGEPLLVNLTTDQDQTFPDVAADAQGGALIAWQSFLQDGDNNGVYARRFAADGQPLSGEIALAQLTADSQQQASVAMRPDGRALVAWTSFAVPGGAIQLRELDASGTPLGDEFSIDPATVGGQTGGVVAIGANGQAWVAWQSFSVDNSGTGIAARTRAPAGGFDGPVLALNASGAGNQTAPQIAVDADGRLAAVWQDEASGGALARRFAADGRPLTEEQPLAASLARAALAVDADGDGVYGWIDAGGARLQRLLGAEPIDLGLGAETDTDPVTPGSALRARFTVRNPVTPRAPSGVAAIDRAIGEVRELHLDVTLPEGARFRSVLGSDSGWRCESPVGSFLHCLQAAPLAAGGETTLQLNLDAPPTSGLATIEALIETLPRLDPAVDNDRAALTVRVQPPTVSVLTPTLTLREGGGSGVLVLGIAPPAGTTVSIPFTRSGSAGSEDVTLSASPLQVPAGASTARLAVSVRDDSLDEPLETLTVQLLSPDGAVLGSPDQAQISVEDNDEAPLLRFSASSLARSESAGSVNLLLQLSEPSSQEVRVALTVSGTATAGVDFQAPSRRLVLPAGSRSLSVPLTLIDDALDEADETVVLSLSNPRGAQLGSPASLTLTLQDDDPSPSLRLQRSSLSLVEGAAAETVQVRLSEASTREVRATLAAEGSASASDYRLDTLQLSIPPGALEAAFTLEALADSLDEADESLTLSLTGLENAVAGVPAALEVVVVDATPPTA
ncbi:MAG TPA: Calx-beta domain-containing protein, partial [Nevskiaceae bacterium]|nr:Calx-beta domain-containing protein [Nevskiaceae bacterium]